MKLSKLVLRLSLLLGLLGVIFNGAALLAGNLQPAGVIAFSSTRAGRFNIYLMDVERALEFALTSGECDCQYPAWSPDGQRIAFDSRQATATQNGGYTTVGNSEIYVMKLGSGDNWQRLTAHLSLDYLAAWSPDGSEIAFASERDSNGEIYVMDANGGSLRRLTNSVNYDYLPRWLPDNRTLMFLSESPQRPIERVVTVMDVETRNYREYLVHNAANYTPMWSPDGSRLLVILFRPDSGTDICLMASLESAASCITDDTDNELEAAWSPDGSRIAFASDRDGNYELYVMDVEGTNWRRLTNHRGDDFYPVWRP